MSVISRKNQITIPIAELRKAGLEPGDDLRVVADGFGRLTAVRARDLVDEFAGSLPGVWEPGFLQELRDEWDSRSSTPTS